jgi:DNA-binding NarL/FixJ family response regulator
VDEVTFGTVGSVPRSVGVLVVDDNAIVRKGLCGLLEAADGVHIVGEASDGEQAERMARQLQPDVTLLDVRMPRRDGIQAVAEVSRHSTVIMLTFTDEPENIRRAIESGASGYLVHGSFDADSLAHTVRAAALGGGAFSRQALEAIRAGTASTPEPRPEDLLRERRRLHGLSDRQGEIMDLISKGLGNGDIAARCFLSEKTVKNHINAIFAKLGVTSRGEAIALWLGSADA